MRDPDGLLCGVSDELRGRVSDDDVLLIARALEARHRSRRLRSFGGGVAVGLALTALATATTSLLSSTGGAAASPASVMTTTRRGSRALLSSTTDAVNWGSAFFAPVPSEDFSHRRAYDPPAPPPAGGGGVTNFDNAWPSFWNVLHPQAAQAVPLGSSSGSLSASSPDSGSTAADDDAWCADVWNATATRACLELLRTSREAIDFSGDATRPFNREIALSGLVTLRRQQERKLVGAARDDVWWCGKKETDAAVHCRASASAPAPALSRATSLFSPATHANFGAREITVNDHLLTFNDIAVGYEKVFHGLELQNAVTWLGVPLQQDPSDAFAIADLLWRLRPDLVIELGTSGGGSAAFYSHVMSQYDPAARLLTMDPADAAATSSPLKAWNHGKTRLNCPHCRHSTETDVWRSGAVRFVRARPSDPAALAIAEIAARKAKVVLVMEDSNHLKDVVYENLMTYARFVTPGSYFIVQDTRLVQPNLATEAFLKTPEGRCFEVDKRLEYFIITQHWDGFLRRKAACE